MDKVWRRYLLGSLLSALVMLPLGYLIWQSLRLLGYAEPNEAPFALQYAALIAILLVARVVFYFAADDAYKELQKSRMQKKRRGE